MIKIVGSYISPYVRKVLVCLDLKGIEYEIDPIIPFYGNDEFSKVSPVRRIPVLVDGELAIPDSTIICEYLEEKYPQKPLYPKSSAANARARWYEEYADSRMGEVFIWRYFNELVIRPFVWGEETDKAALAKTVSIDIPEILDYLEALLPESGFIFDELSIADISIASFFKNVFFARYAIDKARWKNVYRFVHEMHSLPSFNKLAKFEEISVKTPMLKHREALLEAGAPVANETYFGQKARRGILST